TGAAGPREYVGLKTSLEALPFVRARLSSASSSRLRWLAERMNPNHECVSLLQKALVDNPPFRASDGGLFRPGYHPVIDSLLRIKQGGQEWLVAYQEKLRRETGLKALKVGFNKMFGYYIEVSRSHAEKVPEHFQRRQTLVNGERYITVQLKEY